MSVTCVRWITSQLRPAPSLPLLRRLTTPPRQEETRRSDVEEVVEEVSLEPEIFHTRTLQVHEAFRRFRPPRQTWMCSFEDGSKRGLVELHPAVFAANPRMDLVYEVLKWQDACTREEEIQYARSELPGTDRKLVPQKGGGNARSKGNRAPHFKYGGVPMGRRPRDYGYDIEIPTLTASLSAILTTRHAQGDLYIVDSLQNFTIASLANYKSRLNAESVLFVTGHAPGLSTAQNTEICFHPGMDLLTTEYVHPKAILAFTKVVLDYAAVEQLEDWVLTLGQEHKLESQLEFHNKTF